MMSSASALAGRLALCHLLRADKSIGTARTGDSRSAGGSGHTLRRIAGTMRMIDSSGSRRIRYLGSFWDKELCFALAAFTVRWAAGK
jgi:hypothetical protein